MSLHSEYAKERAGWETIEEPWGYVCWQAHQGKCWVHEIYVAPEGRPSGIKKLYFSLASICAAQGIKEILGQVSLKNLNANSVLKHHLHYGFEVIAAQGDVLTIRKVI